MVRFVWEIRLHRIASKDAFYSKLDAESITDEEYERVQNVWTSMGCQNFESYYDLYLTTDTLLLADVFENFRVRANSFRKRSRTRRNSRTAISSSI
jgi:uridine phosphorylase